METIQRFKLVNKVATTFLEGRQLFIYANGAMEQLNSYGLGNDEEFTDNMRELLQLIITCSKEEKVTYDTNGVNITDNYHSLGLKILSILENNPNGLMTVDYLYEKFCITNLDNIIYDEITSKIVMDFLTGGEVIECL